MRDDTQLLLDIIEAIDRIERYSSRGRDVFERDELVQNWIVNHLQVIGEAARSLSADLREANKEVPWAKIIGMRHILVHRYFEMDRDLVWSVVTGDLPELKQRIEAILEER
jgi:uncharacterized protein with HEPN domain